MSRIAYRGLGLMLLCLLGVTVHADRDKHRNRDDDDQLPLSIQGTWRRADDDSTLTFTPTQVEGQMLVVGDHVFTTETYVEASRYNYVFSMRDVDTDNGSINAYFCWKLVRYTDYVWLLYPLTPLAEQGLFGGWPVLRNVNTDPAPEVDDVCSLDPSDVMPIVLYKLLDANNETIDVTQLTSVALQCPVDLLGTFDYVTDDGRCFIRDSQLDFCQDRLTAHANYTACPDKILYSDSGVLSCTASFTHDVSEYVILINHDADVDNMDWHRVVCMKVDKIDGRLTATAYPKDCSNTGTAHTLELTTLKTCPPPKDKGSSMMLMIIGIVVAVDVVALALVFFCIYKKVKAKKEEKKLVYIDHHDDDNDNIKQPDNATPVAWGKGDKSHLPAICPPLDGEVKKNPLCDDVNTQNDVNEKKEDDVAVAHM